MFQAAREITAFVEETKNDMAVNDLTFDIRIGINRHLGRHRKRRTRMEYISEPGRINLSETIYELVKHQWKCEYRGEIDVKNRGRMKMYFLEG